MNPYFVIGCLVFGLYVAFLFVMGGREVWRAQKTALWPKVAGTVTRTAVKFDQYAGEDGTVEPRIEYAYSVRGHCYSGSRLRACKWALWQTEAKAKTVVARYPVGSMVSIAYEPSNPASSVLEPGLHTGAFGWILGGLVASALAGLSALFVRWIQGPGSPIEIVKRWLSA